MNKYGAAIHARFMKAQNAFGDMNNEVLESIRGVRVLRAFVQERQDHKRFYKMTDDVYEKNMAVARIDALFEPTMKILVGTILYDQARLWSNARVSKANNIRGSCFF